MIADALELRQTGEPSAATRPKTMARCAVPSTLGLLQQVRRVSDAVSPMNDGCAATIVDRIQHLASALADRLDTLTWEGAGSDPQSRPLGT